MFGGDLGVITGLLFACEGIERPTHALDHALNLVTGIFEAAPKKDMLQKMRRARDLFVQRMPHIPADGEMQGDAALSPAVATKKLKEPGEVAAASSHQTDSSAPTTRPLPVIRVRIEVIEVSCGR